MLKLGIMSDTTNPLKLDTGLNVLDILSKLQNYEKAKFCAVSLLFCGTKQPKCFAMVDFEREMSK